MGRHYETKAWGSNEVQVIYKVDQKIDRDIMVTVGNTYWVQPDNPLKQKHRGRECIVKNLIRDDRGYIVEAQVFFIDNNRSGKVEIIDLVKELKEEPQRAKSEQAEQGTEPRYTPENVPDDLFTQNELRRMGKVPIDDPEAYVVYPDQKREYKLYNIESTRDTKRQRDVGIRLTKTDYSIQEVLERRKFR